MDIRRAARPRPSRRRTLDPMVRHKRSAGQRLRAAAVEVVLERTETPDIGLDQVPQHSDDWLALIFTNRHDDLRYCAAWNKWLRWDNTRWLVDETKQVFDLARKICREVAVECRAKDPQTAKQLVAAKRVAAVVMLAQSDRQHAATVDQWDADPWLLNTPGSGMVDLVNRRLQPRNRREAYCTKIAGAAGAGQPVHAIWLKFLDRIFAGDAELESPSCSVSRILPNRRYGRACIVFRARLRRKRKSAFVGRSAACSATIARARSRAHRSER